MANTGKQLSFTFEGKQYTLEFNRDAVRRLDRQDFVISSITEKPMTSIPALFHGAFWMHHKGITPEQTDKIFEKIKDPAKLVNKLVEMYNDPILSMIDNDGEDESKNVIVEASW